MKSLGRCRAFCLFGLALTWQFSVRAEQLIIESVPAEEQEFLSKIEQEYGLSELRSLNGGTVRIVSLPAEQPNDSLERLKEALPDLSYTLTGDYTSLFLQAESTPALDQTQRRLVESMREDSTDVAFFKLSPDPIVDYALSDGFGSEAGFGKPGSFKIPLTKDVIAVVSVDTQLIGGDQSAWTGEISGVITGDKVTPLWGRATLIPNVNGISGSVQIESRIYSIRPIGGGLHAILEKDTRDLPEEREPRTQNNFRGQSPTDTQLPGPQSANELDQDTTHDSTTIDLFVAYTPAVASRYLNVKADLLDVAVKETNASLNLSGISDVIFNLAGYAPVEYVESQTWEDHLTHLVDGCDGTMDEVYQQREQYHADIVLLMVAVGDACGEAYAILAAADTAFAVVRANCATGTYTFGHEIAHLIGTRHEKSVDAASTPFQYGHGFSYGLQWRTIMAIGDDCSYCTRFPYWSGPEVKINGVKAGTAEYEDNVRVIKSESPQVAAFR